MIPYSVASMIVASARQHARLCSIIPVPTHVVHRDIALISSGICIGAGITPTDKDKSFVTKVADKYAPIEPKSKIIVVKGKII